ncbi:MAG: TIGR00266 family protein [Planctomycetota bacterium]
MNGNGMTDADSYDHRIDCSPDYSFITVSVPAEHSINVEASAMATMSTNMSMSTGMKGGLSRALTGESIFINQFTAEGGDGEIGIAPPAPGETVYRRLQDETIYLQNAAYVASTPGVDTDTKWQGMVKGFFSGESLFLIRCQGTGDLWFNSYGAIMEVDVDGEHIVDTGFIVAFTDGLDYNVEPLGGFKSFFFSGEGLVCRFHGKGKLWIQTRQVPAFSGWIRPYRPESSND